MFVIVNKKNNSIHREPNKKSYANTQYKTRAAAKAGITRTLKYYAKAIEDVNNVIAEGKPYYYSRYDIDKSLYSLSDKLGVQLYNQEAIVKEKDKMVQLEYRVAIVKNRLQEMQQPDAVKDENYYNELDRIYHSIHSYDAQRSHVQGLVSRVIQKGQVIGVSDSAGNLVLLGVREAFKSLFMCVLYAIFVLAAIFHGLNGLWTFLVTWGIIISRRSQKAAVLFSIGLMFVLFCLGMVSIWGTYLFNVFKV